MTGDITIKAADAEDCDWIVARHATVYSDEFSLDKRFGERVAVKMSELMARQTGFVRIVIAEIDGKRAGSVAVSDLPDNGAFVNFVWVEPEFRRRGLAEMLMNDVLQHARGTGLRFHPPQDVQRS